MHLFVDNLTNVDFSYLHPQRGLVGETWLASIVLEGALDDQGMVCDFGIVKKTLRQWLDASIDHCLLVPQQSPQLELTTTDNIALHWHYGEKQTVHCVSPPQAITIIDSETINPESVASWCVEQLREQLPETIDRIQLRFTPEAIQGHFYHYSHGLKKHGGNCQRIAHGHRSTIEIYQNDIRSTTLEKQWCQQWQDIYIGTQEDLIDVRNENGTSHHVFAYESEQGHFYLQVPTEQCYLIDTDSTVEFIAQHIANKLKLHNEQNQFTVKAFEGIGKGALAFSK